MNSELLPGGTASTDQEPRKARETTTRRTRTVRRAIGLAVAGVVLALVRRRLRESWGGQQAASPEEHGESSSGTDRGGGGSSLGRRVAVMAASAVAMVAVRRLVGGRSDRQR